MNINRPYLFKAVRNRSLNKIRSHNRFSRAIEKLAEYLKIIGNETNDDSTLLDLIAKLPEKQREVLFLRIKAELKISEIAEILGIPEGTVKSRINKGLKFLKSNVEGR